MSEKYRLTLALRRAARDFAYVIENSDHPQDRELVAEIIKDENTLNELQHETLRIKQSSARKCVALIKRLA